MVNSNFDISKLIKKYKSSGIEQIIGFEQSLAISLVHHSSAIEGSTLTKTESRVLIEKGITPHGKSIKYSLMVLDHYEAYQYMMNEVKRKSPFSHELIKTINRLTLKQPGETIEYGHEKIDFRDAAYRTNYNMAAGDTTFIHYCDVQESMDNYVSIFNKFLKEQKSKSVSDKVKAAFSAHYEFVRIHPFGDGNGRTSRLLMNYVLAYCQLPLFVILSENRDAYIDALIMSDNARDKKYINDFLFKEYSLQLEKEIKKN